MIKKYLFILLACLVPNLSMADVEYLVPVTSFDTTVSWVGAYSDIDDYTINDTDYVYSTVKTAISTGNPFSDPVTLDGNDTINNIVINFRTQLTGTPGNEYTILRLSCGTTETLNGGSNASWTTDSTSGLTTCGGASLTLALLQNLTYEIEAESIGGDTVTQWQVSEVWVTVDYTPTSGWSGSFGGNNAPAKVAGIVVAAIGGI